jgi:hypothetical protein
MASLGLWVFRWVIVSKVNITSGPFLGDWAAFLSMVEQYYGKPRRVGESISFKWD